MYKLFFLGCACFIAFLLSTHRSVPPIHAAADVPIAKDASDPTTVKGFSVGSAQSLDAQLPSELSSAAEHQSVPVSVAISKLLARGKGDQVLDLIRQLEEDGRHNWSEGRICWYKSLAFRLCGDHQQAFALLAKAQDIGIPELTESSDQFWSQQKHWSPDILPNFEKVDEGDINAYHFVTAITSAGEVAETAKRMVDAIRSEKSAIEGKSSDSSRILNNVRLATWNLLLGEYTCFHDSLALWTTSVSSFAEGRSQLNDIEATLDLNPELERVVSSDPEVAIRLDSARVRLVAFQTKEALSRQEEVDRLHQLRKIAKEYRSFSDSILRWQTYVTLRDSDKSIDLAGETLQHLQAVRDSVDERSADFHLFVDEPSIAGLSEFEISASTPQPLADGPMALVKAMHGYSLYLSAHSASTNQSSKWEEATRWANASIDASASISQIPQGADASNIIGRLTLALIEIQRGNEKSLVADEEQRAESRAHYARAKEMLSAIQLTLEESGYSDTNRIPDEIQSNLQSLESPNEARVQAQQLFRSGDVEAARQVLLSAVRIHHDDLSAYLSILIGLQSGIDEKILRDELATFTSANVLPQGSALESLAKGQITATSIGLALEDDREQVGETLISELAENIEVLRSLVANGELETNLVNEVKSVLSLSIAYSHMLSAENFYPDEASLNASVQLGYQMAKDAEHFFTKGGDESGITTFSAYRNSVALVGCRLAAGHLASEHLDDWRDESKIFLAAAADEASKLPRANPLFSVLGEPLLKQFYRDSTNQSQKLAIEERQRRQLLSSCMESLFVLRFGSPSDGAKKMTEALDIGGEGADLSQNLDVSELSRTADGFDAKITLPRTLRAFEILAYIEAGDANTALTLAVDLSSFGAVSVDEILNMSEEAASSCLVNLDSPLIAFVVGSAIEAKLDSIPVAEALELRQWLARVGEKCFKSASTLFEVERLADRYRHLDRLIQTKLNEFSVADDFIKLAQTQLNGGDHVLSLATSRRGLSKHPLNSSLWQLNFAAQITGASVNETARLDVMPLLIEQVETASKNDLIDGYQRWSLLAIAYDLIGEYSKAEGAYRNASVEAVELEHQISAASNAERLRISIAKSDQ